MKDLLPLDRFVDLKISRRCLKDYVKEMYLNACGTCSTIIFPQPIMSLICGVVVVC